MCISVCVTQPHPRGLAQRPGYRGAVFLDSCVLTRSPPLFSFHLLMRPRDLSFALLSSGHDQVPVAVDVLQDT